MLVRPSLLTRQGSSPALRVGFSPHPPTLCTTRATSWHPPPSHVPGWGWGEERNGVHALRLRPHAQGSALLQLSR